MWQRAIWTASICRNIAHLNSPIIILDDIRLLCCHRTFRGDDQSLKENKLLWTSNRRALNMKTSVRFWTKFVRKYHYENIIFVHFLKFHATLMSKRGSVPAQRHWVYKYVCSFLPHGSEYVIRGKLGTGKQWWKRWWLLRKSARTFWKHLNMTMYQAQHLTIKSR
jgi:hypothetical protein